MRNFAESLVLPFRSWRNTPVLLILIGLGCLGNSFALPFGFGVQLFFGSIFILAVAVMFGPVWGIAGSLIVSFASAHFFTIPGNMLSAAVEALFVGMVCFRDKRRVIVWDTMYWLFAGVPIIILSYFLQHQHLEPAGYVLFMNVLINGLFNALLADIILAYFPWNRVLLHDDAPRTRLMRILFHLSILAVTGPFLLSMLLNNAYNEKTIYNNMQKILGGEINNVAEDIAAWSADDKKALRLRNVIQLGSLREILMRNTEDNSNLLILDGTGRELIRTEQLTYANTQSAWRNSGVLTHISEDLYVWLPDRGEFPYPMDRWREGLFVLVGGLPDFQLNIIATLPVAPYQQEIMHNTYNQYRTILLFIMLAALLAYLVNMTLVRPLEKLAQTTTGLPSKLAENSAVDWPRSRILEIASLIVNFRIMAENLLHMFAQTQQMTENLKVKTIQLQKSEERLHYLAYYDALTGLPNRLLFTRQLGKAMKEARKSGEMVAVMFLDLDEFKKINDTMGHGAGDRLLQIVANKLQPLSSKQVQIFRLGGDEFVLVVENIMDNDTLEIANEVLEQFSRTIILNGQELFITASIGISIFPKDGDDSDSIVKHADTAMYAAKGKGGNSYQFYDAAMNKIISERMMLESSLRKALELEQFELHYQPKFDSFTDEIAGAEALLRWKHPEKGYISPSVFIPLAEETGMINQIGEWVIQTACKQNKAWQDKGLPKLRIAVNMSARQLYEPDIVGKISRILRETKLKAKYLQLEITEGFFIHNMRYVVEVIRELQNMGVRISIDDFGTGFSSLNQLKHLPIYELKIDQSFIRNVTEDRHNAAIVKAVIEMAHSMGLVVIAEGIETEAEKEYLIRLHCDQMQGYLLSKPLPQGGFEKLLAEAVAYPDDNISQVRRQKRRIGRED